MALTEHPTLVFLKRLLKPLDIVSHTTFRYLEDVDFVPFKPYSSFLNLSDADMVATSQDHLDFMKHRRTVRHFSDQPVPRAVIENCLLSAGRAPSGANKQPWFFGVIETPEAKKRIRTAAEAEEASFYNGRASQPLLKDLKKFKTTASKPYLEKAPFLIATFCRLFDNSPNGEKAKNYYPKESVGLATGFLINALHRCGLATLTHTPSPMDFLNEELGLCKKQYRPFLLLVTGFPSPDAMVPILEKKQLLEISEFY